MKPYDVDESLAVIGILPSNQRCTRVLDSLSI
jgi:hypothetical protein